MTAATNTRSQQVMERIGMTRDPADDFEHPNVPESSPVRPHVLYRITCSTASATTERSTRQALKGAIGSRP